MGGEEERTGGLEWWNVLNFKLSEALTALMREGMKEAETYYSLIH